MADLLHPVADGGSIGSLQVVGNGGNVERHSVLAAFLGDERYVSLVAEQGHGLDQCIEARGPIAFGDGVIRGRFARLAGDGGIELAVMVWGENPRYAKTGARLIAQTRNFTIWHSDWQEYALALVGRQSDWLALYMGNLWIRVVVVSPVGGLSLPTLGVSALWLEVPQTNPLAFSHPTTVPPPEDTFVTVRTFTGRIAIAKYVSGEWWVDFDQPFEIDKHSLPYGVDGRLQQSRAVNGWRP